MEKKESIFEYIDKNIQKNGKLSDKFDLSKYRHLGPNDLRFVDGMIDNCIEPEKDDDVIKVLIETIQNLEDDNENLLMSLMAVDNYYENNPKKTILGSIDNFIKIIIDDAYKEIHQFSASLIYKWSLYLLLFGKEIETVKIGIAVIGLFPLEEENKIVEMLEKLSLCEEFTKYTSIALNKLPNINEIKFRLVKKLSGYGKIILVNDLEPNNEEIKEWLLCSGCYNEVSNEWTAIRIAQKIDIPKMIHGRVLSEDEFEGLCDIVEAMIEENIIEGISIYEQKEELFNEIVYQYNNFKTNTSYLHLIAVIKDYCNTKNFKCTACSDINEILNCKETKDYIIKEIDEGNKISEYTYISTQIDDFDIYSNVFKAFKKDIKKNINCLEYLFDKTSDVNELLEVLRKNIDLNEIKGEPEPIVDFDYSTDLIIIIQCLSKYPFLGEDFIIAGLNSKTMHPRNAALRTIIDWKKETNKSIDCFPKDIQNAILELKDKEIIKSYKEMINEILEIEEDLSSYKEPAIRYGFYDNYSTGVNIFNGDIDSLFTDIIRFRGKDYYKSKMIQNCELSNSRYIAYVQGTEFSTEYKVIISVNKNNEIINMECNCPYPNNCKHEYATLLHIRNKYNK